MYTLSRLSFISLIATACFAALLLFIPSTSQAFYTSGPIPLNGYAWSSTIGWISVNCETGGVGYSNVCATSSYRLTIDETDGTVEGYAWSSSIGWIKFGGLSGFPSDGGTYAQNARLVDVGGGNFELRGWARACAGTTSGDCSTMASRTDGWDGWIALSGDMHNVRLSVGGVATDSYAWGGPVVGWIDMFSHIIYDVNVTALITLGPPCTVSPGEYQCDGFISFTFTNAVSTDDPQINRIVPSPSVSVSSSTLSGTDIETPMRVGDNTFRASISTNPILDTKTVTVSCVDDASPTLAGECVCDATYFTDISSCEPPVMNFEVNQDLIRKGDTATLSISVFGLNPVCNIRGPGIEGDEEVYVIDSTPYNSDYITEPLLNFGQFYLTCSGVFLDVTTREVQVRVIPTFSE